MDGPDVRPYWDGRGLILLGLAILSGPAAWAMNQLVGYALVKPVCASDSRLTLIAVAAAALAMTVAGTLIAWSCLARLRGAHEEGGREEDRSHFLAVAGLSLNLLIALLIVTAAVPVFLLSPCE